ncbi:MAG: flippase [Gemmatimonadetes bacterium]|nr:flippase [Gemmatimonadota bacterium]
MRRKLIQNAGLNLLGSGFPLLLSLVTIPIIIKGLGLDRFGILSLAWGVVGYFGLFDLGLGRATTRFMAQAWGRGDRPLAAAFFATSLGFNLFLGLAGGGLLAFLTHWLVDGWLNIPAPLIEEARRSFLWLSVAIPLVVGGAAITGALEAKGSFGVLNAIQLAESLLLRLGPVAALLFTTRLDAIVLLMVLTKAASVAAALLACLVSIPELRAHARPRRGLLVPLLNFGSWLTVTNVVGPLMTYMDRFVVGAMLSMRAVAYYTAPSDALRRLQMVPSSLARVLFPVFGGVTAGAPSRDQFHLYRQSIKFVTIVLVLPATAIIVLARDLLGIWLGPGFAANSAVVAQVLAIGAVINAVAKPPYALIQGLGRTDVTAKMHLLEFGCYVGLLYGLGSWFGVAGVALAWTIRAGLDTWLLVRYAGRMMRSTGPFEAPYLTATGVSAALTLAIAWLVSQASPLAMRLVGAGVIMAGFVVLSWYRLMAADERTQLRGYLMVRPAQRGLSKA